MIYATLLPTGVLKIGRASTLGRATFARQYFVEPIRVLAIWDTANNLAAERAALAACKPFHVRGELHQGDPAVMLAAVSAVLGSPRSTDLPHYGKGRPRKGEVRESYLQAGQRLASMKFHLRQKCDLI
jgi:hypothetical protein